jgi:two-component system nitrogen regulation sensor histidine kinase NtrY
MKSHKKIDERDAKRRRREKYIIVLLAILISLLTYLGINVLDLRLNLPISDSILVFSLINVNVILLLLLLFLTMRNLVKLLFERRKRIMGARLRTKLVLAFVSLSLLPTIILFFVSVQVISTSIEYWYNLPIERSLKNSLDVAQEYYNKIATEVLARGNNMSRLISYHGYMLVTRTDQMEKFITEKRMEYRLAAIKVFSRNIELRASSKDEKIDLASFHKPDMRLLRKSFEEGIDQHHIQSSPRGDMVSGIVPIFSRTESKAVVGLIVTEEYISKAFVNRLNSISKGLEEYNQFKILKTPLKISYMISLSIVTLLIIFSSVWFGFFLSKGITVPIQELAEGTNRIASGDYDFFIDLESEDEIGVLVNSFNRMTLDLKNSKKQLEEANQELRRSNVELEQRRVYMEIILANVAAGVVSADADGKIRTINKSAEKMFRVQAMNMIGKYYKDAIPTEYVNVINAFLTDQNVLKKDFMVRQFRITTEDKTLALLVAINVLRDDKGEYLGLVAVFEDITDIEQAQRLAAWREVARRIAHEVKNPLTPIQLSAQRLKRRFGMESGRDDGRIVDDCTNMIINQVEELKRLVNEFSSFARMPTPRYTPNRIGQIIREAIGLYKNAQKGVDIVFESSRHVPLLNVDREQIKRVMINLLDNAMDAIDGKGKVTIELNYLQEQGLVRIVVADNGKGIDSSLKSRLFEPYFSTKKSGTGLGLAIVNTIIRDHRGVIRVEDNNPRGSRFIIDFPVKA